MFADQVRILVAGGAGGDGSASFRREAHVPRGGPDGGDGGRGGHVVLVVEAGMTTLGDLRHHPHHRAKPGGRGAGRRAHGRNAADVVLPVPPGTVARLAPAEGGSDVDAASAVIGELMAPGERLVVARGGRGGRGNVHYVTATQRAPRHAQKGEPGESRWIELELKLIAEIGLVGAPNAGKSSLLAALTAATPEVGDYPFTTTSPNLGVIELDDERRVVIADLPGLIEGASEGRGLGHAFLRHVERTRVLLHVVDASGLSGRDPAADLAAVRDEVRQWNPALLDRPQLVAASKRDAVGAGPDPLAALVQEASTAGLTVVPVSAVTGEGVLDLKRRLASLVETSRLELAASGPA
jgi:GTP-binding protein